MAKHSIFAVNIDNMLCKTCGICIAYCPKNVFKTGENGKPVVVYPDQCNGCGLCELRCPDFAIRLGRNDDGRTF